MDLSASEPLTMEYSEGKYGVEERRITVHLQYIPNSTNITLIDIMQNSCLKNFNTVACVRSGILSSLAFLTAALCVLKLERLHVAKHPSCHQYVIFYAAALECITGGVHWIVWNVSQLDFLLQYIKLLQVLIMCHYYITLASRALRKENLADRFMYPFLFIAVLYFTVITALGIFNAEPAVFECMAPYWLALSGAELLVVQLFCVSAFYITRRLNEISTLDSVRWAQKRDLWCVVIIFEMSALGTFIYDSVLQIMSDRESGCSAVFAYHQGVYSPLLVTLMVLKLLLPIWVMLFVFQPHIVAVKREDLIQAYSEEGTYGSIFSDDLAYRQLYQPSDSLGHVTPSPSPADSPCMQDSCMPYAFINAALVRPGLQPIAEETTEDGLGKKKEGEVSKAEQAGIMERSTARLARNHIQFPRGKFVSRVMTRNGANGSVNY